MSWTSRRRPSYSRAVPSESSSLEVDRSDAYATFTGSFPGKQKTCGFLDFVRGKSCSLWTMTSITIGGLLLYRSLHSHFFSSTVHNYDTTPLSEWDHNHYASSTSTERNLLIAQVGLSRQFAEITSRPNRAFARRWGWDYLLHTGEEDACSTVRVLNRIMTNQEQGEEDFSSRAPYSAIFFLPPDAVITNQDFQFLDLIPDDKLAAAGKSKSDLFVWNLNHAHSLDVARLWLDLGDDSSCDMESLWSAIEMSMEDKVFEISRYIQPLQISNTGLVEPRLIKFLPDDESDQDFQTTLGLLESVADSVCYRYYPRCEVL